MNTEMMDKVSEMIEGLCEKLGTTAQYLIPELAKMNIAINLYRVIVYSVIVALFVFLSIRTTKSIEDKYDDFHTRLVTAFMIVGVIFALLTIGSGCDLVRWIASPTAAAVTSILNKLK